MSHAQFRQLQKQFLIEGHQLKLQEKHVKLLSHCRGALLVNPILTLPISKTERSRCLRWRLGWETPSLPLPPTHANYTLT